MKKFLARVSIIGVVGFVSLWILAGFNLSLLSIIGIAFGMEILTSFLLSYTPLK